MHSEPDDEYVGGKAMVKSFIAQLLRQCEFDIPTLINAGTITLDKIEKAEVNDLCKVLTSLVRQLPAGVKVVYMIDRIGEYERDGFKKDMITVLKTVIEQVHDDGMACTVKVLATSDEATDVVRMCFRIGMSCF